MISKITKITVVFILFALPITSAMAQDKASVGIPDPVTTATCGSGEYVISAYYSPVPGQLKYTTGSYEGDIRLNGGGVMTASGVAVQAAGGGFVAAPPCMPFGTKLDVSGLGTMVVLDRGGAIKGNRLDLWMGYGDQGLAQALTWGKRKVFVTVYGADSNVQVTYTFDTGLGALKSYQKVKTSNPFQFIRDLEVGDEGEDVARLQQILKDLGYVNVEVNGVYNKATATAVDKFQLDTGQFESGTSSPTGKFGTVLASDLRAATLASREKLLKDMPNRNLGRGSRGEEVKKLQDLLVRLGYLTNVTGLYDAETVEAVFQFQLNEGVINSMEDSGAGYYGPNTQLALDKVIYGIEKDFSLAASKLSQNSELTQEVPGTFSYISSGDLITDSLREGDSGEQVRRLQSVLKDLNYLRIDPSGYFGPVTTHAVFKFQQRLGLVKDINDPVAGYVGPSTRNALNSYLNSKQKFVTQVRETVELASSGGENNLGFNRVLRHGDRGQDVKLLQQYLKDKGYFEGEFLTEYFGDVTKDALIRFQKANALNKPTTEGVLDTDTIKFMAAQ